MANTRRDFLQVAAGVAAAAGGAAGLPAQAPAARGQSGGAAPKAEAPPRPASEVQVPKMKFGRVEISRLVCGCNPFYGYAHYNQAFGTVMRDYFTADRVCDVLHQCNRFGIDAYNYYPAGRAQADLERFLAEDGRMHLIVQGTGDIEPFVRKFKPLAIYHHGENTDRAFQNGTMSEVRDWCRKFRDLGLMVGVGTHKPEVISMVEEENWDVDFYAGCVYNRTRTTEEWKQVFHGELVEMQGECYLQSDPPRMYKVMRATRKPCFAFKVLAAGRVANAEQAFRAAYESIKPTDGVFIGLFPRAKDEVRENAERVHRLLAGA